ncbi:MAG: hypothetical protein H3Z52_13700 [archaeon]|nr:hypothetical protein [archaeon]MCP8321968.1 hypothetical protein [archaeon]
MIGKYDVVPLKRVRARVTHQCNKCGIAIGIGEYYYTQKDRFLQFLHAKKFCSKCYQEYGEGLLAMKQEKGIGNNTSKKLNNYL